jgi:hypothetical protein
MTTSYTTRYIATTPEAVMATLLEAVHMGLDATVTNCSGTEFGYWIDMDVRCFSDEEVALLTRRVTKEE